MKYLTVKILDVCGIYNFINKQALLAGRKDSYFDSENEYYQAYEFSNGLVFLKGVPDFFFESRYAINLDRQIGKFHSVSVTETKKTHKVSDIWLLEEVFHHSLKYGEETVPAKYRDLIPKLVETFKELESEIIRLDASPLIVNPDTDAIHGFCIRDKQIDVPATLANWRKLADDSGIGKTWANVVAAK